MILRALDVFLASDRVGTLIQLGLGNQARTRFVPETGLENGASSSILTWATKVPTSYRAADSCDDHAGEIFHTQSGTLPAFVQNMLPEGPLREHLARIRGCASDDHFDILAACGNDLPGGLIVRPSEIDLQRLSGLIAGVTSNLEPIQIAPALRNASSLAGVQPKLALAESDGRYVASLNNPAGRHIIAKLPTMDAAGLTAVEALSMRLAHASGVTTCRTALEPMASIDEEVPFNLPDEPYFLAVERFDRGANGKIHCEEFAQILAIPPQQKYKHPAATYAHIAEVLMQMGREEDVAELVRRLAVNELLGNRDAHAKNFGVIYEQPGQPRLSPAYDIVAHAAYFSGAGHALPFVHGGASAKRGMSPLVLQQFCAAINYPETKAREVVRRTGEAALDVWPSLIADSRLHDGQKRRLLLHLNSNAISASLIRRNRAR
ncbi:MAG: type II toxin-antitoxin system HipA family toxin [Burkholderiales bacterium]|nr:type II toxin-antitoxin system HipA family toxin [Burkholderiales bacterium]